MYIQDFITDQLIVIEMSRKTLQQLFIKSKKIILNQNRQNINNNEGYWGTCCNIPVFINNIILDHTICFLYKNRKIVVADFLANQKINFDGIKYEKYMNDFVFAFRNQNNNIDKQENKKSDVSICKYCLIRQAVKCNGIFKFNGGIQQCSDYCEECSKQISFYFMNLQQNQPEDYSDLKIRNIIEQKNYQNGLLIADTSLLTDEDIEKVHSQIKRMASNVIRCDGDYYGGKLPLQKFKQLGNKVHDGKYTYDKVKYNNLFDKVIITCKIHGDFQQMACSHIFDRKGCMNCHQD